MPLFFYRLSGAALLDRAMYEGIEADPRALPQAIATVLLASLAAGVGASGWRGPDPTVIALASVAALLTWFVWATLMLQIGGHFLRAESTRTSLPELLRTIGFAASPGLLFVLAALPNLAVPVFVLVGIWMFVATLVAVRQALDFESMSRAILVCAVAAAMALGMILVIGLLLTHTTVQ